jgi:hypothetical protein
VIRNWFLPRLKRIKRIPKEATNGKYIPTFVFEETYKMGYKIEELGPKSAKPGKLFQGCLFYRP